MAQPPWPAPKAAVLRSPAAATTPPRHALPQKRVRDEELEEPPSTSDSEMEVAQRLLGPSMARSFSAPNLGSLQKLTSSSNLPGDQRRSHAEQVGTPSASQMSRGGSADGKPVRKRTMLQQLSAVEAQRRRQARGSVDEALLFGGVESQPTTLLPDFAPDSECDTPISNARTTSLPPSQPTAVRQAPTERSSTIFSRPRTARAVTPRSMVHLIPSAVPPATSRDSDAPSPALPPAISPLCSSLSPASAASTALKARSNPPSPPQPSTTPPSSPKSTSLLPFPILRVTSLPATAEVAPLSEDVQNKDSVGATPLPKEATAGLSQAPAVSTSPTVSPPRDGHDLIHQSSGGKRGQDVPSRPGAAPVQSEATRTSSLGSMPDTFASVGITGPAVPTQNFIDEEMPAVSALLRSDSPSAQPRDNDIFQGNSLSPHQPPAASRMLSARKSASSRSAQISPSNGVARKSAATSSTIRPDTSTSAAATISSTRGTSRVVEGSSHPRKDNVKLARAAASLPTPSISTSPASERAPPTRSSSLASVAPSTSATAARSTSSADGAATSRAIETRAEHTDGPAQLTRLRRGPRRDSSSSAMAVDQQLVVPTPTSSRESSAARQMKEIPRTERHAADTGSAETPPARSGRKDKGKGKARLRSPSPASSSDDDEEAHAHSGPAPRRKVQPAEPRERQAQAWEEPDLEDFVAGALHPKRFHITITSLTLLAMDAPAPTKELPRPTKKAVTLQVDLRDAAAISTDVVIASATAGGLEFECSSASNHRLATLTRPPVVLSLLLVPSLWRSVSRLVLDVSFKESMSTSTASLSLTTQAGRLILCRSAALVPFSGEDNGTGIEVGWTTELLGGGAALSTEELVEETDRRIRRLDIDANPTWLPDAKPLRRLRSPRMPSLSGERRGFDMLTKHPFAPNQLIKEINDIDTPASAIPSIAKYDRDIRRADLTPKERLIFQLHFRWCQLHPFPGLIVDREVACWTHFASTVHHFHARAELAAHLNSQLVIRDAHPPLARVEMRNEGKPEAEIRRKKWTGLLSAGDWQTVMKAYDEAVRKIGPGGSYEELRSAAGA